MNAQKKENNAQSSKQQQKNRLDNFLDNVENITDFYRFDQERLVDSELIHQTIDKITDKLASMNNVEYDHALIGICALFQSGAYLKSVTARRITIAGKEFTKKNLNYASDLVESKFTYRIIARYLNKTIATIALKYSIPGHLYSRFKVENANLVANNTQEKNMFLAAYCADFQIENPDTPSIVREFLASREKYRRS